MKASSGWGCGRSGSASWNLPGTFSVSKTPTRERILHAALEVFARKGYHRAVVDDIVRVSETSKGAVYHHFPNKEAIFLALVDDFAARLADAVAHAIAGAQGALGKVEAALRAGLETFARNRDLARLLLLEAVSLGPAYETKRTEIHERFAALIGGYLDQAVEEGAIPKTREWRPWPGWAPSTRW